MLNESGFVLAFDCGVRILQSLLDISADDSPLHQDVCFPAGMDALCIGGERPVDGLDCGQIFPSDREVAKIKCLHSIGLPDNRGHALTSIACLVMREHWLVGKAGDYTIAIDAGNVLRGEDRGDPRVRGHEAIQIAKTESRAMIRTSHNTYSQRGLGTFIRSKDFCAVNFLLAVEADQPRPHGRTGLRRKLLAVDIHFLNRANDLAISRTAAEHSANRVHDFLLGWRRVPFEQRSG